jgi:F-type H+-transporting ATPase subunit b
MTELLHDTNFWVSVSFFVFVLVAYKYGKSSVLSSLDGKIDAIRTELTQAEKLRVDSQELLAEYQRKHKDAISEAATIIADAKKHAENIKDKAQDDLQNILVRREEQLQEKLSRIEQNASQEIQSYVAGIAVNAARDLLNEKMDAKAEKTIISNMMGNVPKTLN